LIFFCCGSVAALALANRNKHVAKANITALAHTQRALHGAQSPRGKSGKITSVIPFGIHALVPPAFPVSRAKLPHGICTPLRLFLSRAPRLQAVSSREISHMQAGQ
jgi:hypothetical protein